MSDTAKNPFLVDKYDPETRRGVDLFNPYIADRLCPETPEAEAEMRRSWQLMDVDYYYDLDLDAAGRIIGGEWYTPEHPDFLWTPEVGARAVSRYESVATGEWDMTQVLPVSWREAAVRAAREGVPLAGIVEGMIQAANV